MIKGLLIFSVLIINILSLSLSDALCEDKIMIVTSLFPIADLIKQVGGERVSVDYLIPPGVSPHAFEPKPSDMKKLNQARIFFVIGGRFEFWADKSMKALDKKPKLIILSKGLPLLKDEDHRHHDHDREEAFDPHIWLDPLMVLMMVERIRDALIELDPLGGEYYIQRAWEFKEKIMKLHQRITETVKGFKIREFVTFHSAWNYFSKRYGLKVLGIIEESPGKEASPAHIARIVKEIRKSKTKVVFVEPQFNPKEAVVIAKETGAKVFMLDPIGGPDIRGRDSYINLMDYNLTILKRALGQQ